MPEFTALTNTFLFLFLCKTQQQPQRCYWRNLSKRSVRSLADERSSNDTSVEKPVISESISLFQALEVRHESEDADKKSEEYSKFPVQAFACFSCCVCQVLRTCVTHTQYGIPLRHPFKTSFSLFSPSLCTPSCRQTDWTEFRVLALLQARWCGNLWSGDCFHPDRRDNRFRQFLPQNETHPQDIRDAERGQLVQKCTLLPREPLLHEPFQSKTILTAYAERDDDNVAQKMEKRSRNRIGISRRIGRRERKRQEQIR